MAERVVEDPVLAQRYIFRRVAVDGEEVMQVDTWVDPDAAACCWRTGIPRWRSASTYWPAR